MAVINTPYAYRNYFHFLIDTLSRLAAFQLSGMEADWYCLSAEKKYEKECIKIFGLDENKVISPKLYEAFTAQELIVPSLPYKYAKGTIESVDLPLNLDHSHWEYIKNKVLSHSPKLESDYSKIYLSRANAPQRKVSNEEELSDFLLKEYGIRTVFPENFSVAAQAAIFNQADMIISAHGAGLANLIFAKKDTTVIEIFPENYKPQHYRMMSEKLSLKYFFTCIDVEDSQNDFEIPLEAAEEIINYALA
jgi:capsular polysaccharide biosynthesis protein